MENMLPKKEENMEFFVHVHNGLKAHVKKNSMDEQMKAELHNL
jgi:hypothetical protein